MRMTVHQLRTHTKLCRAQSCIHLSRSVSLDWLPCLQKKHGDACEDGDARKMHEGERGQHAGGAQSDQPPSAPLQGNSTGGTHQAAAALSTRGHCRLQASVACVPLRHQPRCRQLLAHNLRPAHRQSRVNHQGVLLCSTIAICRNHGEGVANVGVVDGVGWGDKRRWQWRVYVCACVCKVGKDAVRLGGLPTIPGAAACSASRASKSENKSGTDRAEGSTAGTGIPVSRSLGSR